MSQEQRAMDQENQKSREDTSRSTKGGRKKSSSKSNYRGKKSKPQDKPAEGYKATRGSNDISWHTPDVALLERASEVSWSYQTGELLDRGGVQTSSQAVTHPKAAQAGIFVIREQIGVGGGGFVSPTTKLLNYTLPTYNAANSLLTEMRSRAKIRNTYDAPDVLMLMTAMADIYGAVALAKRLAATVRMFTYQNQYLPRTLIKAQGFDPDWFLKNQFQFVTELNIIISEINKIYIPNKMHLFQLINERYSNYYTEGDSIKDQMYLFTPAFLNAIDYNPSSSWASWTRPILVLPGTHAGAVGMGSCKYDANGFANTGDTLLLAIRYMLNCVIQHDSTADITGDMENCFGPTERFLLGFADPNAIALPIFDEEILETIHNMSWSYYVSNAFRTYDSTQGKMCFHCTQDASDNRIGMYDAYEIGSSATEGNRVNSERGHKLIDVHKDPNNQKTFAITRLRNYPNFAQVSGSTMYVHVEFAADCVVEVEAWEIIDNNGQPADNRFYFDMLLDSSSNNQLIANAKLQPFHYRPLQPLVDGSMMPVAMWVTGETDIFANITEVALDNMNRISLLTLLGAYNNV